MFVDSGSQAPVKSRLKPIRSRRVTNGRHVRLSWVVWLLILMLALLAACRDEATPTLIPTADTPGTVAAPDQPPAVSTLEQSEVTPTSVPPTAIPPSPTPMEPMAARVNGNPIWLADYEKELARFIQAQVELGLSPTGEEGEFAQVVLEALIETELIAQGAEDSGVAVTDEMVMAKIAELKESVGDDERFLEWLEANQWTEGEFHQALQVEMVTEQMVALITVDVPFTAEQVHARYIQVDDADLAQSLLEQVRSGVDFIILAQQYSLDRITGEDGGDLGFFAQGSLLVPEVESAAFALEPGALSEVVVAPRADGSGNAYYLVQLIERDPARQITTTLRSTFLQEKFESWLADQWNQAEVERFIGNTQ